MLSKLSMILTIYRSIILITENKSINRNTISSETVTQIPIGGTIQTATQTIIITHTITVTQEKSGYSKEYVTVDSTTANLLDVVASLLTIVVTVILAILVVIFIKFIGKKNYQYAI